MMWDGDRYWGHHGWWWPGAVLMAVLMIACVIMMVRMMRHGAHGGSHLGGPPSSGSDSPERTLGNRLAQGDIDVDEYERRLAALQRSREVDAS